MSSELNKRTVSMTLEQFEEYMSKFNWSDETKEFHRELFTGTLIEWEENKQTVFQHKNR